MLRTSSLANRRFLASMDLHSWFAMSLMVKPSLSVPVAKDLSPSTTEKRWMEAGLCRRWSRPVPCRLETRRTLRRRHLEPARWGARVGEAVEKNNFPFLFCSYLPLHYLCPLIGYRRTELSEGLKGNRVEIPDRRAAVSPWVALIDKILATDHSLTHTECWEGIEARGKSEDLPLIKGCFCSRKKGNSAKRFINIIGKRTENVWFKP